MDHLKKHQLLSPDQYGFRPKRSCTLQLLHTLEDWSQMIEDGNTVDAIYLDYQKAFDAVPHQRLLSKLKACGIGGKLLEWIKAFLMNRRQQVVINGECSDWVPVTSGVPQGSVLGPLLFVLYINDMLATTKCPLKIFADDTKIYQMSADSNKLQADIEQVLLWSNKWQLPFNEEKCKVLHIGTGNQHQAYVMRARDLEATSMEKDLGCTNGQRSEVEKACGSCHCKGK